MTYHLRGIRNSSIKRKEGHQQPNQDDEENAANKELHLEALKRKKKEKTRRRTRKKRSLKKKERRERKSRSHGKREKL